MKDVSRPSTPFRYASPADEDSVGHMPSFRRRIGRGGRVLIDRKLPRVKRENSEDDRFKYDSDDDEFPEHDPALVDMIYARMSQRAYLLGTARPTEVQAIPARRAQIEAGGPSHSSPAGPSHTQPTPAPS